MGRFGHVFDRSDESDIRWVAENRLEARVCSGGVTGRLWAKNTERARALLGLFCSLSPDGVTLNEVRKAVGLSRMTFRHLSSRFGLFSNRNDMKNRFYVMRPCHTKKTELPCVRYVSGPRTKHNISPYDYSVIRCFL